MYYDVYDIVRIMLQYTMFNIHHTIYFTAIQHYTIDSLAAWYGGGPKIIRKIIDSGTGLDLEIYPIYVKVATCDTKGRLVENSYIDKLYSKTMYIKDILHELCDNSSVDINKGKLWNYAVLNNINEQYILQLEYTIKQSKIQDGQTILFEVCLDDGTWPRSQLQQTYTTDNSNSNNNNSSSNSSSGNKSPQRGTSRSIDNQQSPSNISGNNSLKLNDGRVGLGKQLEYRVYIYVCYIAYTYIDSYGVPV